MFDGDKDAAGSKRLSPTDDVAASHNNLHSVCIGGWRPAVCEVAVAVYDGLGEAKASVGLLAPADRIDDAQVARLLPHVFDIAAELSKQWGFKHSL